MRYIFVIGKIQMRITGLLIILIIFNPVIPVYAAVNPAFKEAGEYYAKGKYKESIEKYHQAEKDGMHDMALYFNLGSAYFKTGNYGEARAYYQKSSTYKKIRMLSLYNLGLVSVKLGEQRDAQEYFQKVVDLAEDKKLRQLASNMLGKETEEKGLLFLRAGAGIDDNINFSPTGSPLNVSDSFYTYMALGRYLVAGNRNDGWQIEASGYSKKYDSKLASSNDYFQVGTALDKINRLNNWDFLAQLSINKSGVGNVEYQTIYGMQFSAKIRVSNQEDIKLRYGYEDIQSDNWLYDYLKGWRKKIRIQYSRKDAESKQRYYYEFENNKRENSITASYSPERHTVRGIYRHLIDAKKSIVLDLAYRTSDYGSIGLWQRDDNRIRAA
ncbi:MAG: tetratricopeptide repeat protein, partial [Gammaproteobacteria bacterium]|nr:tetratricopeptide repeat protein [Gammaproteobacteria bacterium]